MIERWPASAPGRSRAVAWRDLVWAVANATDLSADFAAQTEETLKRLEATLQEAGSSRSRLLSVQVILADIDTRKIFDSIWRGWIGPDPQSWPQRACFQAVLAPGLLVELVVVAARD